jgi:hypothetical protein
LEKFEALQRVREQLLVRLDLATGVLGYLDLKGSRFVLNTQRGIAEDSCISAPVLSRLFKTLDAADYVYRRIERVRLDEKDEHGLHLVRTRVLIRFTKLFWNDLGLRFVYERVQKAAKKRRDSQLRELSQQRLAAMERHSLEQHRREVSRQHWQAKETRQIDVALRPSAARLMHADPPNGNRTSAADVDRALGKLLASVVKPARN